LEAGAAALRSDGSDGKVANAMTASEFEASNGPRGAAAGVGRAAPDVMMVNSDADVWSDKSSTADLALQWVTGHESLHTVGLHDQVGTNNQIAYRYGVLQSQRDAYEELRGTARAMENPDNVMTLVYP
jgi:hypothetical protein